MIADCAVYVDGRRVPGRLDVVDAFEAGRADNAFVWIGLADPTAEEFAAVQEELALHPLAVEDAVRAHQRPKLETFDQTAFVVVKTAAYDDADERIVVGEIHVFVGDGFVVTVRHGSPSPLSHVRARLEMAPEMLRVGPGVVLYAVIDHAVDDYQTVVDGIEQDIDDIEEQVFTTRGGAAERIFRLRRQVLAFHRAVSTLQEVLEPLVRQQVPQTCRHPDLPEYFRDVLDHTIRLTGRIETDRDTLGSALEANLAQVGVRQNEDMRAISGWAAIIAVPTMLAGVWGMNFEHMPELDKPWGYPVAIGSILASAAAVRWKLRRNGWL